MSHSSRNIFICLLLLIVAIEIVAGENKTSKEQQIPLQDLRIFTEIFTKIKNDYVEPIDDKEILENAIYGMLERLDPHSSYLDQKTYRDLKESTSGKFGGLGIEVTMENGFVKVIAPIDDTPSQRAGIKAGDLIIKLDNMTVKGMSLNDTINIMRGEPNTAITLTIIRQGKDAPLIINIIRDIIKIQSVKFNVLEPGFGYLRISNFQSQTVADFHQTIDQLKQENEHQLKGIVLDLRNNPGGILTAAVGISDMFLNKGLIVYTKGRHPNSKLKFNAKPNAKLPEVPLVVLVNAGSASASEIVAGALQDHRRAIIMGTKTFGKGSVQTVLPINNNAALKLTTAKYYTPNGRSIQNSGIVPDIIIEKIRTTEISNVAVQPIKEADLARRLDNEETNNDENKDLNDAQTEQQKPLLSLEDHELYEALNVLKGLAIINQ